jgi:hypothetical protein
MPKKCDDQAETEAANARREEIRLKKINVPLATQAFRRIWETAGKMLDRNRGNLKRDIKAGGDLARRAEPLLSQLDSLRSQLRYLGLPITPKEFKTWDVATELVERLEKDVRHHMGKRIMLTCSEIQLLTGALLHLLTTDQWRLLEELHIDITGDLTELRLRNLACHLDRNVWCGYADSDPQIKERDKEQGGDWEFDAIVQMLTTGDEHDHDRTDRISEDAGDDDHVDSITDSAS